MLSEWEKQIREPHKRLQRFVKIMYDSTPALLRSGCPMGTLAMEFAKGEQELKEQSKKLFDLFQRWLANQFTDLGYATEAHDLSLQLLARGQGLIVVAQVYQDPGFLERGTQELDRWIDELARYA